MEDRHRLFLNSEVSDVVGITKRQTLSWSEKGLVRAFEESTGVGTKRQYDYINLLEFSLCKSLFSLGMGFRIVKRIINQLSDQGDIRAWAEDFRGYFKQLTKSLREAVLEHSVEDDGRTKCEIYNECCKVFLGDPYEPAEPVQAVLLYSFGEGDTDGNPRILPWGMSHVVGRELADNQLMKASALIAVDLNLIKARVNSRL